MSLPSNVPATWVHSFFIEASADAVSGLLMANPIVDSFWYIPKAPSDDDTGQALVFRSFGFTQRLTVIALARHHGVGKEKPPPPKAKARSAYPCLFLAQLRKPP